MSRQRIELQVGVALILALVALVWGLMWFQEYQIGSQYKLVRVHFEKVGGLGAGDPVEVRGISMGKVRRVSLVDDGVMVELRLRDDVTMHDDAVVRLGSAGIMGERMIAVEPGRGGPVDLDTHVFEGTYEAASTELVGQFEQFNQQVMAFLQHADQLLTSLQQDSVLTRTLENTSRVAVLAADLIESNHKDLERAAESMADISERFSRFLADHEEDLSRGAQGLARATDSLDSLTTRMTDVLAGTQDVLTALKEQKGAAGKMIYDEAAGENLVKSLEQLRFLVEDLQRNPQRYLTVKIF